MADISKIVLPGNNEYDIKDAVARSAIAQIPTLPSTAGKYVLNVAIVSGSPVYSWVEAPTSGGPDIYTSTVSYTPTSVVNEINYSVEIDDI